MRIAYLVAAGLALAAAACGADRPAPTDPSRPRTEDPTLPPVEPPPPEPECRTPSGAAGRLVDVFLDGDRDGHGAGAAVSICTAGEPLAPGYAAVGDDCDDVLPSIWRPLPYFADLDGDGVGAGAAEAICSPGAPMGYAVEGGDCDATDPLRWRLLPYRYRDADGDGFTVDAPGSVCAGAALPQGYLDVPNGDDCSDADPTSFAMVTMYFDADEDGVGAGDPVQLCGGGGVPPLMYVSVGGDCAPFDRFAFQALPYAWRDADGDGYFVATPGTVCAGGSLPPGYSARAAEEQDCDDRDRYATLPSAAYLDADGDGAGAGEPTSLCYGLAPPAGFAANGSDCAPDDRTRWQLLAYTARDADGDGFHAAESGTVCSGLALPAGYTHGLGRGVDCDDTSASLGTALTGFPDADRDGYGAAPGEAFCALSLPDGYVANATDCAPADPLAWRTVTNLHVDADRDGFTTPAPEGTSLCIGAAPAEPYHLAASGKDCDDADAAVWSWTVLYPDADGDRVGAPPRQVRCLGAAVPSGFSTAGWDVDDRDAAVQWDGSDAELVLAD